jgi:hypothetical protein
MQERQMAAGWRRQPSASNPAPRMKNFILVRSPSLSMVVLVLLAIVLMQGDISYSTSFGILESYLTSRLRGSIPAIWLLLRVALLLLVIGLWVLNRKRSLFKVIIVLNGLLTLGLVLNMIALGDILTDLTSQAVVVLLRDVFSMAVSNILIFSIWYWVIDPPGVEDRQRIEEPWDFLFPQRASPVQYYEAWAPRFTDYLYLAFTTSVAFSPTDTLPLSRRAKLLMLLQAAISIITLTVIAGSAINILAGGN